MDTQPESPMSASQELPAQASESSVTQASNPTLTAQQKKGLVGLIVGVVVLLILTVLGVVYLAQPSTDTARIRDIFIIFLALQSILIGVALVVLLIQLARLINLLQNEVKPILDSTNETVGHLRGTTIFLSEQLVEPLIKLNEYLAGFTQLMAVIGLLKKARRSPPK